MSEAAGAKNAYRCQLCGFTIVTINRDEGTTPFMLRCRRPIRCQGMMHSAFYRLPENAPEPSLEWYRPSEREVRKLPEWQRDHVEQGGLLYRGISK